MHHDGIVCWDFSGMGPVSESPNGFAEGLRRGGRELWLPLALSQLRLQGMLRQAQWAGSRPCKRGAAVLKAPFSSPSTSIAVQGHAPRMTKTAAFFFFFLTRGELACLLSGEAECKASPSASRPAYLVVLKRGLPAPCGAGKLIPLVLAGMPGIPPPPWHRYLLGEPQHCAQPLW